MVQVVTLIAFILHIVLEAKESKVHGKRFHNEILDEASGVSFTGYVLSFLIVALTVSFELEYISAGSGWRSIWRFLALSVFLLISISAGLLANSSSTDTLVETTLAFDLIYLLLLAIHMFIGPCEPSPNTDREFFFTTRPNAVYLQLVLLILYLVSPMKLFIFFPFKLANSRSVDFCMNAIF